MDIRYCASIVFGVLLVGGAAFAGEPPAKTDPKGLKTELPGTATNPQTKPVGVTTPSTKTATPVKPTPAVVKPVYRFKTSFRAPTSTLRNAATAAMPTASPTATHRASSAPTSKPAYTYRPTTTPRYAPTYTYRSYTPPRSTTTHGYKPSATSTYRQPTYRSSDWNYRRAAEERRQFNNRVVQDAWKRQQDSNRWNQNRYQQRYEQRRYEQRQHNTYRTPPSYSSRPSYNTYRSSPSYSYRPSSSYTYRSSPSYTYRPSSSYNTYRSYTPSYSYRRR